MQWTRRLRISFKSCIFDGAPLMSSVRRMKVIAAAVLFVASLFPSELGAQTLTNEVNFVQVRQRVSPTNASTPADDISAYDKRDLLGWRVLVNQKLIAQTNLCLRTMRLLGSQRRNTLPR